MISSSPKRHTFQMENYVNRCEDKGEEPREDYLNMYKSWQHQDEENMVDPNWQKDNLEYDLRSTAWILEKARADEIYAQHLYSAMCNREFVKNDVWPILQDTRWSCSWRHAGGIISDMREEGDYIDWYCSGIKEVVTDDEFIEMAKEQQELYLKFRAYVGEGVVTDEIRADLLKLGWVVVDNTDEH